VTYRAKSANEGFIPYVNSYLAANPNATANDISGFANSAGLQYDPSSGTFSGSFGSFAAGPAQQGGMLAQPQPQPQPQTAPAPAASTAASTAQPQHQWSADQVTAARDFFATNPSADTIYNTAQNLGLNQSQLADLWSKTGHGTYDQGSGIIGEYLAATGKTLGQQPQQGQQGQQGQVPGQQALNPYGQQFTPSLVGVTTIRNGGAQSSPWTVTPDQTVEGRLKGLLSDENPLVQMARTQGLESANARGLLNSSLGAQAGALAHYQYAMPVAQADAQTYANAARANADNDTQVSVSNAALNQQSALANQAAENAFRELERRIQQDNLTIDKQSVEAMKQNYTATIAAAERQMQQFIQTIQASDIPVDQKQSQVTAAMQSFNNTIGLLGRTYSAMPGWVSEWSLEQFELV